MAFLPTLSKHPPPSLIIEAQSLIILYFWALNSLTTSPDIYTTVWTSTSTIHCCHLDSVWGWWRQSGDCSLSSITTNTSSSFYHSISHSLCYVTSYLSITVKTRHLSPTDSYTTDCDCTVSDWAETSGRICVYRKTMNNRDKSHNIDWASYLSA